MISAVTPSFIARRVEYFDHAGRRIVASEVVSGALPDGYPRFVGSGVMRVPLRGQHEVNTLGAVLGRPQIGVSKQADGSVFAPIPFEFAIEADDVVGAFAAFGQTHDDEARDRLSKIEAAMRKAALSVPVNGHALPGLDLSKLRGGQG